LIGNALRILHVAGPKAGGLNGVVGAANQRIVDLLEGQRCSSPLTASALPLAGTQESNAIEA
jgi:hypothetical protein